MNPSDVPPLAQVWGQWDVNPALSAVLVVIAAAYAVGLRRLARHDREHYSRARAGLFLAGLATIGLTLQGPIEVYWEALYWMHMIGHLLLIMVAPILLVLGHPLTVARYGTRGRTQRFVRSVLDSRAVSVLTHPVFGFGAYFLVIFGTHLTNFLDVVALHPRMHWLEVALYLVGGYLFFLPLLGSEPIRWHLSPPTRGLVLFLSMPIDTGAGVALMLYGNGFLPNYMAARPSWALDQVTDLHAGGAIMWVGGDGLMMVIVSACLVAWVLRADPGTTLGPWIESVRASTLRDRIGYRADEQLTDDGVGSDAVIDEDEHAHEAYNAYLARLQERETHLHR